MSDRELAFWVKLLRLLVQQQEQVEAKPLVVTN